MSKAESFQKMSSNEVADYLKKELGIPDFICQAFEGNLSPFATILNKT